MQVKTPDIGVDKATVAEILVKVGDTISENDSLILLESDKASVEVPSTAVGVVKRILVSLGDEVTEGTDLVELESEGATAEPAAAPRPEEKPVAQEAAPAQEAPTAQPAAAVQLRKLRFRFLILV